MLYTKHNITELDLEKYTRFVTIGCSFTSWLWPTWADLMARELPNAKFINIGCSGAGNTYINTMLNYVSRKYNFGPETLVGVMWSTFYREDRFVLENPRGKEINNDRLGWHMPGGIDMPKTKEINDRDGYFVKTSAIEPYHYIIRDLALINSATCFLKSAKFDTLTMAMNSLEYQIPVPASRFSDRDGIIEHADKLYQEALQLYQDIENDFVGHVVGGPDDWPIKHSLPTEHGSCTDYHPRAVDFATWLEQCGIPLSSSTKEHAQKYTDMVDSLTDPDWGLTWPWNGRPLDDRQLDFYEKQFTDQ